MSISRGSRRFLVSGAMCGAVAACLGGAVAGGRSAGDQTVAGTVARVRDTDGLARRSTQFRLVDPAIDVTGVDPTVSGATVEIFSQTGPVVTLTLPAANWRRSGASGTRYRYRSQSNPRLRARVVGGSLIELGARGAPSYVLGGVPQVGMALRMTIGPTRFCAAFGGTIVTDDGSRFLAFQAPAPATCPLAAAESTTSTTSTTTTSEPSTTATETTTTATTTTTLPTCGDGSCQDGEDADNCYADCGSCPDGVCTVGYEDANSCYLDCGFCGDGLCTQGPEDANNCYSDCGSCGDGVCSPTKENEFSCYGDCGSCGDAICSGPENSLSCPSDCFGGS